VCQKSPTFDQKSPPFQRRVQNLRTNRPTFCHPSYANTSEARATRSMWVLWVCQKSPIIEQKGPTFNRRAQHLRTKHPTFCHPSYSNTCEVRATRSMWVLVCQKSPTFDQKGPIFNRRAQHLCTKHLTFCHPSCATHVRCVRQGPCKFSGYVKRALYFSKRALHLTEEPNIYAQSTLHSVIPPVQHMWGACDKVPVSSLGMSKEPYIWAKEPYI